LDFLFIPNLVFLIGGLFFFFFDLASGVGFHFDLLEGLGDFLFGLPAGRRRGVQNGSFLVGFKVVFFFGGLELYTGTSSASILERARMFRPSIFIKEFKNFKFFINYYFEDFYLKFFIKLFYLL
jgi:hypothetical protein